MLKMTANESTADVDMTFILEGYDSDNSFKELFIPVEDIDD